MRATATIGTNASGRLRIPTRMVGRATLDASASGQLRLPTKIVGRATLNASASGQLRLTTAIQGRATLDASARAQLRIPVRMVGRATLALAALAMPPRHLGAKFRSLQDQLSFAILEQTLTVWVNATPPALRLRVQIDESPEQAPALVRANPNGGLPAIYIVPLDLPSDGMTHHLSISAWTEGSSSKSLKSRIYRSAKIAAAPVPIPAWVHAHLIRQTTTELPDLVEIAWRANTAVTLVAKFGKITQRLCSAASENGEGRLLFEGLGTSLSKKSNDAMIPVTFGAIGLRDSHESPVFWGNSLTIRFSDGQPDEAEDPDRATAVEVGDSWIQEQAEADLRLTLTDPPANLASLVLNAQLKLKTRIKEITRKGGSVTLDDLGRFEARWNPERTLRSIGFVASPGFVAGTRQGRLLTDAQAKEQI